MLIYKSYLISKILRSFFTAASVIVLITWILQILRFLYLIDKGIDLSDFFNLTFLVLPYLLFVTLPFSTLFSFLYTYTNLATDRESIILKNAGLSDFGMAKPALAVAAVISLFAYYLSFELMPSSYTKLKSSTDSLKNSYVSKMVKEKTFNQISKHITLYLGKKEEGGELRDIILFDNRDRRSPAILFAKSAYIWDEEGKLIFRLTEGRREIKEENGLVSKLFFDHLIVELGYGEHPTEDKSYDKSVNEYRIGELLNPDPRIGEARKIKLKVSASQRIIWPAYNFILPFIALAFFLPNSYLRKKLPLKFFSAFFVVGTFLVSHFSIENSASKNISLLPLYYLNFILFSALGYFAYKWNRLWNSWI